VVDGKRLLAAAVAIALAAFAVAHLRGDRRVILRQLGKLTALLERGGPEQPLASWGVARQVGDFFAPDFLVAAPPYEGRLADRQQLAAAVHRFRGSAERISVTTADHQLAVRDNGTAELGFVATVSLQRPRGPARESFRVRALWQKDEGRWRIHELELLEVLESPGWLGF
jgi:hypothetical protein